MDPETVKRVSQPAALRTALKARAGEIAEAGMVHHRSTSSSIREATHKGHTIKVRTTYTITVDDKAFDVAMTVDNDGSVHYYGLPTRSFASVIGLVKKTIDLFPSDFDNTIAGVPGPDDGGHTRHGRGGMH